MDTKRKIELLEKLIQKSKEIQTESESNPTFKSWKNLVERTFVKIFGENFLERIKEELNNNILVIFLLSNNFYESPICLCEMGATWVKTNLHIPIIIPPFGFGDIKGVIPLTHGLKITDGAALNQIKTQIEKIFKINNKLDFSTWERKRDRIINRIEKTIK